MELRSIEDDNAVLVLPFAEEVVTIGNVVHGGAVSALIDTAAILPHGLALSALASVMVGFAGWHGGKLVFDHGVGILISPKD